MKTRSFGCKTDSVTLQAGRRHMLGYAFANPTYMRSVNLSTSGAFPTRIDWRRRGIFRLFCISRARRLRLPVWAILLACAGYTYAAGSNQQVKLPAMKMHVFAEQEVAPAASRPRQIAGKNMPPLHMVVFNDGSQNSTAPLSAQQGQNLRINYSDDNRIEVQRDIKSTPRYQSSADQSMLMYDFSTGYRRSRMDWNVAAPGGSPNPLTEVKWSNLDLWGIRGLIDIVAPAGIALKANAGYAWTFGGSAEETGYASDGRQNPFSRITGDAGDGYAWDASLGLGYQFRLGDPQQHQVWFAATPLAGYAYREQKLTASDGQQQITSYGLNSQTLQGKTNDYVSSWHGPWVGMDMRLLMFDQHELFTSFEHHWIDYHADGDWQQSDNLSHPDSFSHNADGSGYLASLGYRYRTADYWGVSVSVDYQNWTTDPGTEDLYFSSGETVQSTLNEVNSESFGVNLGLNIAF